MWTLILGHIARAAFAHVPASMWGAMAGRSPHEAIFLQDTALDMNPYEMIVASLNVQGAFQDVCSLLIPMPMISRMPIRDSPLYPKHLC